MKPLLSLLLPLPFLLPLPVAAQQAAPGTTAQAMQPAGGEQASPADQGYMSAMRKMNQDMMQATDSDPGRAWTKKMIAHHQGAIDMSRVALQYTKDSQLRREIEKTVSEQERSIRELNSMLQKHGS